MLKWILGILALIIVVVAGTCYYGFSYISSSSCDCFYCSWRGKGC